MCSLLCFTYSCKNLLTVMPLILNIDTSTEQASICLAEGTENLCLLYNLEQKEHAAWLHPAIQKAFEETGKQFKELQAVGITAGPGSYTGLRVAMATAKGICYALKIPLITVNTLEAMASAALSEEVDLICPMIDARRMEVFSAIYDKTLTPVVPPAAIILDKKSFFHFLEEKKTIIFGNGQNKFKHLIGENKAIFKNVIFNSSHTAILTYRKFLQSDFTPLAYSEPVYLKDHHTPFFN